MTHFTDKISAVFAADPEVAAGLIDITRIGRLLASRAVQPPRLRLFRAGERVPDISWASDGQVDIPALWAMVEKGASLIIDDIGPLIPAVLMLEQSVERRLGATTLVNAYYTGRSGGAFAAHFDCHDVLVVQVSGAKEWTLFGPVEPASRSHPDYDRPVPPPDAVTASHRLEPGSMLYLPRGTWHRASVAGDQESSLHLTISIIGQSGLDYLRWIVEKAADDDLLAADLTRASDGSDGDDAHADALRKRLHELVDRHDQRAYLSHADDARPPISLTGMTVGWQPADGDMFLPALRRKARIDGGGRVCAGGQTHRLDPAMAAILGAVEESAGGIAYAALQSLPLPAGNAEDAVRKLLAKGLIALKPGG